MSPPLYDFECSDCQESFEAFVSLSEKTKACESCGGIADRRPPAPRAIGMSDDSKEMKRREGKRERVSKLYEKHGIKL